MANNYSYQYDTSPRKLDTNYSKSKNKNSNKRKKNVSVKSKTTKKNVQKSQVKTDSKNYKKPNENVKNKNEINKQKLIDFKIKCSIGFKTVLIFAAFFFILFREAQINELFSNIQELKSDITTAQKENDQLEISIQNSINANHIEQAAKELLGMQKLTSKQTVYISLPKEDYVEHNTEEVIITEEKNWFESLVDNIKNSIGKK